MLVVNIVSNNRKPAEDDNCVTRLPYVNFKTACRREFLQAYITHMIPDTSVCTNVGSEGGLNSKGPEAMSAL